MTETRPEPMPVTPEYVETMRQRVDKAQEQLVLIQGEPGMNALAMWLERYILDVAALVGEREALAEHMEMFDTYSEIYDPSKNLPDWYSVAVMLPLSDLRRLKALGDKPEETTR